MKKQHTKIISLFLLLLLTLSVSVHAVVDKADIYVSLQIGNPWMQINGEYSEIDPGRSTAPVIYDNRTLVPIRAIIESFGGQVRWDESAKAVILTVGRDSVRLIIDSKTAYFNNTEKELDSAPRIINDRTMLPIRFIAQSFNLGVAWDSASQKVYIIRNSFDTQEYNRLKAAIPPYNGKAYAEINNNIPYFRSYEIIPSSFEYYSSLDPLGRCDVCFSSVSEELMPTGNRESISSVTPTGWINAKYDSVPGGYLYNRCHLIGFQLTGENSNEKNLITGTRYLNIEGMLPFENMIDDYVERTKNHVLYRVTPLFTENNLVADGVLMEAYSVEDSGKGITFCVYCYNIQPTVNIDYLTGLSSADNSSATAGQTVPITTKVYCTPTGKRYHKSSSCGGKNSSEISLEDAIEKGLTPCQKCAN